MSMANQKSFAGESSGISRTLVILLVVLVFSPVPWLQADGRRDSETDGQRNNGLSADYAPLGGTLTAAMEDITWTDASRKREVPVRIYAPAIKHGNGSFPAVVFSHGGGESRDAFGYLGPALARNGYIIVFLTHRGSDREALRQVGLAALGASAFEERPADVSFAIDRLLSANPDDKLLKGRIDPERIAVAGQCAGATTVLAVAGLTTKLSDGKLRSYRDPRPKAVVALSPQPGASSRRGSQESLYEESWKTVALPALVITGTRDFQWVPAVRRNPDMVRLPYTAMSPGDKYLVEIAGAQHHAFTDSKPYYPGDPRNPRHHGWIAQATIGFLDAYLKGDKTALNWLRTNQLEAATEGQCKQDQKLDANAGRSERAKPTTTHDFAAVDAFLEKSLPRMDGGCSFILIQGDQVIYRKAFGSFTPETVVPIASASKWISGGVIMALVDDGAISLNDKASKYLPEFTGKKGDITIRQMFSHTHGFPDQPTYHRDTRLTMEEAVGKIAGVPLAYDPGTKLYYSGLGMQVAGRIAEIAAGKPWVEIFQEKIAIPLGMNSTTYYAFGRTKNPNVAGSVETCIDDYGNFVTMVLNHGAFYGKRVLSEMAVETMLSNQSGDVPILRHPWQSYTDFDPHMAETPYGIGCWLEEVTAETGKALQATSGGAFGCQPFVDLKRNVAGVFLPRARTMKRSSGGLPYNDASVVFLELRPIMNAILDGKPLPAITEKSDPARQPAEPSDDSGSRYQIERIFRFADRDGDGKLSREEVPEQMQVIRRAFDRLDRDSDGKLSRDELKAGLKAYERQFPNTPVKSSRPLARSRPKNRPEATTPDTDTQQASRASDSTGNGGSLYKPDRGSYSVSSIPLVTLDDRQRKKQLQIRVTYPEFGGPFPVILFSHYSGGTKDDYNELLDFWVSHGYVCLVPNHADSPQMGGQRGPGALRDWRERALDIRFLLESLNTLDQFAPELKGKLDLTKVGAGGHLIGAHSTGLVAGMKVFDSGGDSVSFADPRIRALLMMSPTGRGQGLTEASWEDMKLPMMVMAGSENPSRRTGNPPEWRTEPFKFTAPGDKYLVFVMGLDGTYGQLFGENPQPNRLACYVLSASLAFWDAYLKSDGEARSYLVSDQLHVLSDSKITLKRK